MKKTLLKLSLLLTVFIFAVSCKNEPTTPKDSFTVSGTLKGLDTEFMSTSYNGPDGERVTDSVFVKDGSFTYTAKINAPTHVIFWPFVESTVKRSGGGGYYPVKSSQFAFIASPGANIEFKGEITDFVDAYPSGTKANDDLAAINSKVFPLMNKSINYLLEKIKLEKSDARVQIINDSITLLDEEVLKLKKEFIKNNPGSIAAAWYLSDMMMRSQTTDEESVSLFKNLDDSLKDNAFYQQVDTRIKGIESTLVGKIVPNFSTTKTLDGSEFSLSSLRGKYVLIDFWGTWCGPCIEEMPTVKEYQLKYPDKLAILGVNSGESIDKINKFIEPQNYNWQQIITGEGDDNFVLKFNVTGFPTKFILDPEGKILYKFIGSGEESFTKLDELLK